MKKGKSDSQKGFTLVEVIIGVAILSIIMTSLFSFMTTISKFYQRANNEVVVQNEVQTLMMQLDNIIVDANVDVFFENDKLYVMSKEYLDVVEYDEDADCLYYYRPDDLSDYEATVKDDSKTKEEKRNKAKEAANIVIDDTNRNRYLFAEYISSFSAAEHFSITENYVVVTLSMEKMNTSFTGNKNVYLRNWLTERVIVSAGGGGAGGAGDADGDDGDDGDDYVGPTFPDPVVEGYVPDLGPGSAVASCDFQPGWQCIQGNLSISPISLGHTYTLVLEFDQEITSVSGISGRDECELEGNKVIITIEARYNSGETNVGYWMSISGTDGGIPVLLNSTLS